MLLRPPVPVPTSPARPRRRRTRHVAVVTVLIAVTSSWPAGADSIEDQKREADRDVARIEQVVRNTGADLAAAYVTLRSTEARLPRAGQALTRARQVLTASIAAERDAVLTRERAVRAQQEAKARYEAVTQRLAEAVARQQRATEQRALDADRLDASQDALDAYAAEVFQSGQPSPQLSLLLGMSSPRTLAERSALADIASQIGADAIDQVGVAASESRATQGYLTAVAAEVRALRGQVRQSWEQAQAATGTATFAASQAEIAKRNAVTARDNAAAAQRSLQVLRTSQTRQTQELTVRKAQEESELAAKRADARRLQTVLLERARIARRAEQLREAARAAKIRAENAKAAAARRAGRTYRPSLPPPVTRTNGGLGSPLAGTITSRYGMRWHPVLQRWMLHDGLDIAAACGTPVYAAADGQVMRAGWNSSGWGNQVLVDHGIRRGVDLVTSYNHLSRVATWDGPVRRGQVIGYVGTTGFSTGCHLHFGTYEDGRPVNPDGWL
ncbi:MAG: peptidoglycan DD-metalloendopeptidase family protein [Dermatophilaceae bacterium]|nr:peptidoglycan DD-metalloendopeptidase family protein [Dermatophilaceae bacterium]